LDRIISPFLFATKLPLPASWPDAGALLTELGGSPSLHTSLSAPAGNSGHARIYK